MFIDIDGFKRVNDNLGHAAGDRALRTAATRIGSAIRPADTLARFGGDEFTVLCEDLPDSDAAMRIADRITAQVSMPFELDGSEVVLGASVGVAVDACGEMGADELMHAADQAMYDAKHRGGGRAAVWQRRDRGTGNEIRLEADLRRSMPHDLRAVYQPQVELADGRLVGAEALVRWDHPERGLVSPGEFIPVAERSGLVVPLGRWMLHTACAEAARLSELAGERVDMSVNVSPRQMSDESLIADVESALSASSLPPSQLQLELTESTLIEDLDAGVALVERLKRLGVSVALDDFGTGYSSLSYLKRLPVDTIKIDRSFVSGIPDSREDVAIVAAVISFGRALGMKVVAEGVETEAHVGCAARPGLHTRAGLLLPPPRRRGEAARALAVDCRAMALEPDAPGGPEWPERVEHQMRNLKRTAAALGVLAALALGVAIWAVVDDDTASGQALSRERVSRLDERVDQLEEQVEGTSEESDTAQLERQLDDKADKEDVERLRNEVKELGAAVEDADSAEAVDQLSQRVDELEQRVDDLEGQQQP